MSKNGRILYDFKLMSTHALRLCTLFRAFVLIFKQLWRHSKLPWFIWSFKIKHKNESFIKLYQIQLIKKGDFFYSANQWTYACGSIHSKYGCVLFFGKKEEAKLRNYFNVKKKLCFISSIFILYKFCALGVTPQFDAMGFNYF